MTNTFKLFAVTLKGHITRHHPAYVVARNPTEAYDAVRKWLDDNNYGFSPEREMGSIELIAEDKCFGENTPQLYIVTP